MPEFLADGGSDLGAEQLDRARPCRAALRPEARWVAYRELSRKLQVSHRKPFNPAATRGAGMWVAEDSQWCQKRSGDEPNALSNVGIRLI